MLIKDRIKEFRRVPAKSLVPNPKNWRTHPDRQKNALKGVLAEIGYADALLARELQDGSLQLIDGHLRAETTPDLDVPVLVLDLDDSEAEKLLAILDPLSSLAETNHDLLAKIVEDLETQNIEIQNMLDEMLDGSQENQGPKNLPLRDMTIPELYQIVVQCRDESDQKELFERLVADGRECKILNL